MDKPMVRVRVDENGALAAVEVDGQEPTDPADMVETTPSSPPASFADDENLVRRRPWIAGG